MKKLKTWTVKKTAGQQFLGNEFAAYSLHPRKGLELYEFSLAMGPELKSFRIEKRDTLGAVTVLLHQSIDPVSGNPAPLLASSVHLPGAEYRTLLLPGEQIQVVTSMATNPMEATLRAYEVDL